MAKYKILDLEFSKLSSGDTSLTLSLMDGEDLKADKMSSIHPNSNTLDIMETRSQEKLIGKKPRLIF